MDIIRRLFEGGERFSYECEWFQLNEAKLQLRRCSGKWSSPSPPW